MTKTTNTHTHEEQTYKPDILDELLKADFTESLNSLMSDIEEQYNQGLTWMNEFLEGYSVELMDKAISDLIASCSLELPITCSQCLEKRKSE